MEEDASMQAPIECCACELATMSGAMIGENSNDIVSVIQDDLSTVSSLSQGSCGETSNVVAVQVSSIMSSLVKDIKAWITKDILDETVIDDLVNITGKMHMKLCEQGSSSLAHKNKGLITRYYTGKSQSLQPICPASPTGIIQVGMVVEIKRATRAQDNFCALILASSQHQSGQLCRMALTM